MKILRYTFCLLFTCLSLPLTKGASYRLIGEHALDIGDRWEYQVVITEYPGYGTVNWVGTDSEEIVTQENIAGYDTVRIEITSSISPLGDSWLRSNCYLTPDYLVEVRWEDEGMIELVRNNDPFELMPVWINDTDNNRHIGHGLYTGQLKVPFFEWDGYQDAWITFLRTETITVSAGTFDCIVIFTRYERHDVAGVWGYVESTCWINPEAGIVKSDEYGWVWNPTEQRADIIRGNSELASIIYGNPRPEISSVTATPSTILDEQTSQLQVIATDSSTLSYNWIIQPGQGSLDDYTSPTPIYTPPDITSSQQTFTITVDVFDGSKTSSSSVDINVIDINSVTCDFYEDGFIDFLDFAVLADYVANGNCTEPNWCEGTDVDHSGNTDFSDLSVFTKCWLTEVIDPDLLAYWPLDDNEPDTFVSDISVNGHNATATANTDTLTTTGKIGTGCFDLQGAYCATVGDHGDFTFIEGVNGDFSIFAWVYVTSRASSANILTKWDSNAKREWAFQLKVDNKLRMWLADQSVSKYPYRVSDEALTNGWHFVGVIYNGEHGSWTGATAANYITLYVDGAAVDSTATNEATYEKMENLGGDIAIGALLATGTPTNIWADKIDNVKIFSKCLTATEITVLYGEGL